MIVAALFSLFVYSQDCEVPGYTQEFDRHFRNAVLFYWPQQQQDWCNLKAQGIVESDLRLHAVSPVGAQCIMQIMPSTENDLIRHTGMVGNIFEARYCINMGALYMSWLFDYFVFERTDECRTGVALPAYNTGAGHIDEGQVLSGGERCWPGIAPFLVACWPAARRRRRRPRSSAAANTGLSTTRGPSVRCTVFILTCPVASGRSWTAGRTSGCCLSMS